MSQQFQRGIVRLSGMVRGKESTYGIVGWHSLQFPGLALHVGVIDGAKCLELGWTVSHCASGTVILRYIPALRDAVWAVGEVGPLCDWTLSAREVNTLATRDALVRSLNRIAERLALPYRSRVGEVSANALRGNRLLAGGVA